jgi:hypothetical protein
VALIFGVANYIKFAIENRACYSLSNCFDNKLVVEVEEIIFLGQKINNLKWKKY